MIRCNTLLASLFVACFATPEAALAELCATGRVSDISVGYQDEDLGNVIHVKLEDKDDWLIVHRYRNLNDSPGYALLHLLTTAKITGTQVVLHDHMDTACSSFNAVVLING